MENDPTAQKDDVPAPNPEIEATALQIPFPSSFVYSNASALSASFMDLRIGFAEVMQNRTIEPRVGIVMPPEHAAQLALNLLQQLYAFERNFGEIRHPAWREFKTKSALIPSPLSSTEPPTTA